MGAVTTIWMLYDSRPEAAQHVVGCRAYLSVHAARTQLARYSEAEREYLTVCPLRLEA